MIALLCEDASSRDFLKKVIPRIVQCVVKPRGYSGVGDLINHGAKDLSAMKAMGCNRFVVCADSDAVTGEVRRSELINRVYAKSTLSTSEKERSCVLVAVQEVEAWILANLSCVKKVISSWTPNDVPRSESLNNPKEQLIGMSRNARGRELYRPTEHNGRIGEIIDISVIRRCCPSFHPLENLLLRSEGNVVRNEA